jgi:hypothetical protein
MAPISAARAASSASFFDKRFGCSFSPSLSASALGQNSNPFSLCRRRLLILMLFFSRRRENEW